MNMAPLSAVPSKVTTISACRACSKSVNQVTPTCTDCRTAQLYAHCREQQQQAGYSPLPGSAQIQIS